MLATDADISPEENARIASVVIGILSEDSYFSDASLVAENIQTLGYMKLVRSNLELLQTGQQARPGPSWDDG